LRVCICNVPSYILFLSLFFSFSPFSTPLEKNLKTKKKNIKIIKRTSRVRNTCLPNSFSKTSRQKKREMKNERDSYSQLTSHTVQTHNVYYMCNDRAITIINNINKQQCKSRDRSKKEREAGENMKECSWSLHLLSTSSWRFAHTLKIHSSSCYYSYTQFMHFSNKCSWVFKFY
jgi:hypothetical protein